MIYEINEAQKYNIKTETRNLPSVRRLAPLFTFSQHNSIHPQNTIVIRDIEQSMRKGNEVNPFPKSKLRFLPIREDEKL
jgi:hypothetical protein